MGNVRRPHHYLKIAAESGVGKKLQEFADRCAAAEEKAHAWVEKLGCSSYFESTEGFAGGVTALIYLADPKNEDLEMVHSQNGEMYFCPKEDTELLKEMNALPVVSEVELIAILALERRTSSDGKPLPMTFGKAAPPLFLHHGFWYTDVPYKSTAEDCQEIPEKEFLRRRMARMNEQ